MQDKETTWNSQITDLSVASLEGARESKIQPACLGSSLQVRVPASADSSSLLGKLVLQLMPFPLYMKRNAETGGKSAG